MPETAAQNPETAERNAAQAQTAERNGPAAKRAPTPIEAALGRLIRRIRAASNARPASDGVAIESLSAPAFRALVAERLRSLERDTTEIRTRINGLLFVVAGAVFTELVTRVFA